MFRPVASLRSDAMFRGSCCLATLGCCVKVLMPRCARVLYSGLVASLRSGVMFRACCLAALGCYVQGVLPRCARVLCSGRVASLRSDVMFRFCSLATLGCSVLRSGVVIMLCARVRFCSLATLGCSVQCCAWVLL